MLASIESLRHISGKEPPAPVPRLHASPSREAQLERCLSAHAGACLTRGFQGWRSFCALWRATEPLEDEVFTLQKEVRRGHAMLQAMTTQMATLHQAQQALQAQWQAHASAHQLGLAREAAAPLRRDSTQPASPGRAPPPAPPAPALPPPPPRQSSSSSSLGSARPAEVPPALAANGVLKPRPRGRERM